MNENNIKLITPKQIISNLSTGQSRLETANNRSIDNKEKLILQTYGLYDKFVGMIIENNYWEKFSTYSKDCLTFSNSEFDPSGRGCFIRSVYKNFTGHLLPVMNIEVSKFLSLISKYENFELINNMYGTPSVIFGNYPDGKPIIMPIINWNNLPSTINPYSKPIGDEFYAEKDRFATCLQIAPPPQFFHSIVNIENTDSFTFSNETIVCNNDDIKRFFEFMLNNNEFINTPIACTPRKYELSTTEILANVIKVDQIYKAFELQKEQYMSQIQELTKIIEQLKYDLNVQKNATNIINDELKRQERIKQDELYTQLHYEELANEAAYNQQIYKKQRGFVKVDCKSILDPAELMD